jgi:hypothetical protein
MSHTVHFSREHPSSLPPVWAVVYERIANGTVPIVSELTAWMVAAVSESEITT